MAEVTNELMYELLKRMNQRLEKVGEGIPDLRHEFSSMRGVMVSMQADVHDIMVFLVGMISGSTASSPELREMAEPLRPYARKT